MSEAAPGHVGDVEQAVHAIEIDERAEVGEILHRALDTVADLHAVHELLTFLAAFLLDQFAAAEHDVLPVVVDLDDLEIVSVADELLQILRRDDVNLRRRQKRFDADVHHQSAFDDGFHLAFDQAVFLEHARDLVPILAIGRFLLRKHDHAFVVLEPLEQHVDFVTDFEILDVLEFRQRNNAFRFVTDIDQHFAWSHFQNSSFDNRALPEIRHRLRHHILHLHHI